MVSVGVSLHVHKFHEHSLSSTQCTVMHLSCVIRDTSSGTVSGLAAPGGAGSSTMVDSGCCFIQLGGGMLESGMEVVMAF